MTDWNKEADLIKEWIGYFIDQKYKTPQTIIFTDTSIIPSISPSDILSAMAAQGICLMNGQLVQAWPLPFENWKVKYKGHRVTEYVVVNIPNTQDQH